MKIITDEHCTEYSQPGHPERPERITPTVEKLRAQTELAISAGFDAYARDPLAQETLEAEDYYWLGQSLRNLGVPMLSTLEGGYSNDLAELIYAYLKGVEGK